MNPAVLMLVGSAGAAAFTMLRHRAHCLLDVASGSQGHALDGPVLARYIDEGGPTGALGLPVSSERRVTPQPSTPLGAHREAAFEFGMIYVDRESSATTVVLEGGDRPPR